MFGNLMICIIFLSVVFFSVMITSIPFLLITFIVYAFIRELRNLHGKSLMAYVLSLTCMYTILVILGLHENSLVENYNRTCRLLGYSLLGAIFMCFFWLNVMCLDIWMAFKGKGIRKDDTKFFKYCAYAFGTPCLLVLFIFILSEFKIVPDDYGSGIGQHSCAVADQFDIESTGSGEVKKRQLIYVYAPITIFIVINTIFYSVTACKIYRVQQETSIVKKGESSRHAKKEQAR